jgi:mono/diheme cytochrome c family protein
MRTIVSLTGLAALLGAMTALAGPVDTSKLPPASNRKDVTYPKDIKPLLDKNCIKCHGAEKQKGHLRLDSLAGALKGGEDGKVIQPGDSAKSLLIHNVARLGDQDLWMPPPEKGSQLRADQIGLLRAWIDQGAK